MCPVKFDFHNVYPDLLPNIYFRRTSILDTDFTVPLLFRAELSVYSISVRTGMVTLIRVFPQIFRGGADISIHVRVRIRAHRSNTH